MEFKRTTLYSKFEESGFELVINSDDVRDMIRNTYLHDQQSLYIVTSEGNYEDSKFFHFGIIPDRIKKIEKAYNSGHTIIIKELENWNEAIQKRCNEFENATNVHLYQTPQNGTGFGWHTDDRDVYIYMQIGEKCFEVEEPDQTIKRYELKPGSRLFIPYGAKHRALPTLAPSVHLGFGVWPRNTTIKKDYEIFPINIEISL